MRINIQGLAAQLQMLLTEVADRAAKESGFVRRVRRITGAGFVRAMVLGFMADPDARIDDIAGDLGVAEQSLHGRLDGRAVGCLSRVLRAAIAFAAGGRAEPIPLLRRFTAVLVEDTTSVALPAGLAGEYPGCGGSRPDAGKAGLKILARIDVLTGELRLSEPAPSSASDRTLQRGLPDPEPGALRLVDLGFFDLARMAADAASGSHWVSRVPARVKVRDADADARGRNISDWLREQPPGRVDKPVRLGLKGELACRLVAERAPEDVARLRLERLEKRARKQGRKVSESQRELCKWTVMVTDLMDTSAFTAEELRVLYRVRWQVELMFKRWKDGAGLAGSRCRRGESVLCTILAKLIGVLISHWTTLLRGGPLHPMSPTKAAQRVRRRSAALWLALASETSAALVTVLNRIAADLARLPKRPRRQRQTTRQTLFAPNFRA